MKIINLNHNFSTTRKLIQGLLEIESQSAAPLQYPILSPPNPEGKGEGYFKQSYDQASGLSDNSPLPLVTIITVVFNGEKYLEPTIQSVINQTYDNVEYIVIDGGSTDGKIDYCKSSLNRSL